MFLSINFFWGPFWGPFWGREKQEKHGAIPYEKWMSQGVVRIVAINGNIIWSIYTWRKRGDCSVIAAENIIMLLKNSLNIWLLMFLTDVESLVWAEMSLTKDWRMAGLEILSP